MKFQCASDANCPQGFTCEETDDGDKICEPISNAGGSAGGGGTVEGGAAGDGGMQGGNAGSAGTGGGVEGGRAGDGGQGGSAGAGGSAGMGGEAGDGGTGNTGGGAAGEAGNTGNGGAGGDTGGASGGGGMAGSAGGNGGGTGIGGADGNPLENSDTVARGYIHFAETKRGNLPAEIYGQARFASFTRFPVPVNDDDIWPDRNVLSLVNTMMHTSFFLMVQIQREVRRAERNVGMISVSGGAQNFSLDYQEFAESYSLNPDEIFDLFNEAEGDYLIWCWLHSIWWLQCSSPIARILSPTDVDLERALLMSSGRYLDAGKWGFCEGALASGLGFCGMRRS